MASLKRKNPNLKLLVSLRPDDYFSFDVASSNNEATTSSATINGKGNNNGNNTNINNQQQSTTLANNSVTISDQQNTYAASTQATSSSSPLKGISDSGIQMNEMHQKFAKRIRDFIVRHSLDGINLDWPYFAQIMPSVNASREHLTLVSSSKPIQCSLS